MNIPILIINRDGDSARLRHVTGELSRLGLSGRRVRAVEGHAVPQHLAAQFCSSRGAHKTKLLPGEVGCYASHLLAAEQIVSEGHPVGLVLEDDVAFDTDFSATVTEAIKALPEGWDIVRLSSPTERAVLSIANLPGSRHLVRYSRLPKQTGAYLISRAGALKFLAPRARIRPVDADLRYAWNFNLDTYGVSPRPVRQDGFTSTIRAVGQSRRMARGGRWQAPGLLSRLHGCLYMLQSLGLRGLLACAGRNLRITLIRSGGENQPSTGPLVPILDQTRR